MTTNKRIDGFRTAMAILIVAVLTSPALSTAIPKRAANSGAPSYPEWAAAIVPAYPNVLPSSGPRTPYFYGIETTDAFPTVVAWYKARVHGAWSSSERETTWTVKVGNVRIQVSKNILDDSGEMKTGTRVAITRRP